METTRTVVCRLAPTPEQVTTIEATLVAFAGGCNQAADVARSIGSTNKVLVQRAGYLSIRQTWGLSANLAIRAIARACAALKVPEKWHSTFQPTSIDYDARIFTFHEWNWSFGLMLLSGRGKIASRLGDYQRQQLIGRHPTSAVLVKSRLGEYDLHVQLADEAPPLIDVTGTLGVDLGIVNLATDSDGETFSGAGVEAIRRRYQGRRRILQSVGTKNAKRHLQHIRRHEANFRKDVNHKISKRLIAKATGTARAIALENLSGIRTRTTVKKAQRSRMHGWGFDQLRQFIAYKALAAGVPLLPLVDPRNSSRTCSRCGHCDKRNRPSRDVFLCLSCAHSSPSDWNAAENIRDWAAVLRPMACIADTGPRNPAEMTCKPLGFSPSGS